MDLERFEFRGLHPRVFLGTTTDRYAGWLGQIYPRERYEGKISRRSHTVGGKRFTEEILPVESAAEYFRHFPVLEADFTFYRLLLEKSGKPSPSFQVLKQYRRYLKEGDGLFLKAPQAVFARRLHREGKYLENESYLDAGVFREQFYDPAVELLGPALRGIVFEQEYHRKDDRLAPERMAADLDLFFGRIPPDARYHLELRTVSYLSGPVFEVLESRGVGQVLSHWTWLPPLAEQFAKSGSRFFNSGRQGVIRLLTPRGMRYEAAYAKAFPFDRMVEGMMPPQMVEEAAQILWAGAAGGLGMNLLVNNRAGGNAPLVAREIARRFQEKKPQAGAGD